MAAPLMIAAFAVQAFGQIQANYDQAKAEMKNAKFYKLQSEFAQEAGIRQAQIASFDFTKLQGSQVSAFAKSGVSISGSAASVIADTAARKVEELTAIKKKTALDVRLATLRSIESEKKAKSLQDPINNLLMLGGTAAQTFGSK